MIKKLHKLFKIQEIIDNHNCQLDQKYNVNYYIKLFKTIYKINLKNQMTLLMMNKVLMKNKVNK